MSDSAEDFLGRVMGHVGDLDPDKFSYESWKFEGRPTSEGVGMVPNKQVNVQKMVDCILNVEDYPKDVQYVEHTEILERFSDTDFTYVQRVKLPIIGRIQMAIRLADFGERDGYRVVAWAQEDDATMALNKKQGYRTAYNLGAWLLKDDQVSYALSSCPMKKDVGSLKFAIMTKGGEATGGQVVQSNITGMTAWSERS